MAVEGVTGTTSTPVVNGQSEFIWYYHPDHLGSTGFVTDQNGELYEHIEYFPFGETWVQEKSNTQRMPYLYTGKELDEETGLYYYGARYYDPRTSVWQSADPILGDYLNGKRGMGGVFNSLNLGLYAYAHVNPTRFIDPDGNATWVGPDGAIQVVTEDKDLSIYIIGDGAVAKIGETLFPDSFVSPETGNSMWVGDSFKPLMRINFGHDISAHLDRLNGKASEMPTFLKDALSQSGQLFDVKNTKPGHEGKSYDGFLLDGKYISLRDAGNILAGMNAKSHGQSTEEYLKGAGAYAQGVASGGKLGGIFSAIQHKITGNPRGDAPYYGEDAYTGRAVLYGYQRKN